MSIGIMTIATLWGVASGYLVIRILDRVAGLVFCLHALIKGRWNRLAGKVSMNQVNTDIILRLMLQLALLLMLFGSLLYFGTAVTLRESGFDYEGASGILYALAACAVALSRLPSTRRRLIYFWKMSHEFDYAQRRQRTLMLTK
ncbi:MAG TPA: hypothetical protein VJ882_05600 [Desulfuromonadales bacterium]|nr:hypothetical protein [Desulfuromonadales bacterium]